MITTILFDLDDTILDFHKAEAAALKETLIRLGVDPTDEILRRYSEINASQWKLLEKGKLTREQILVRRFRLLFEEFRLDCSSREAQDTYEYLLSQGHFFMPYAEEVLDVLVKEYDMYLVSNGTTVVQNGRIKSSGVGKYFKDIFLSEAIGYVKPQKEFFEVCLSRMPETLREHMVIIGDSLTSDIRGGNNMGIQTIWMNPKGNEKQEGIHVDHEIKDLRELPELLKRM